MRQILSTCVAFCYHLYGEAKLCARNPLPREFLSWYYRLRRKSDMTLDQPRGTCKTNILHIKWKQNIVPPFGIDRIVILKWNYFFTDNTCQRFQRQRPNDRFPWCFSDHAWLIQCHIDPDGSGARSIFVTDHRAPFSQSNIEVLAGKRRKTVFQTTVWNWRDRLE